MRLIDADVTLEQMKGMNMLFSPKIVIDNMPTIDLAEHDKQIRDEVIDRFMNLCDAYCHFNKDKHPANGYVISRASLLDIAEKMKGEQND